jgi:hypothetical protein
MRNIIVIKTFSASRIIKNRWHQLNRLYKQPILYESNTISKVTGIIRVLRYTLNQIWCGPNSATETCCRYNKWEKFEGKLPVALATRLILTAQLPCLTSSKPIRFPHALRQLTFVAWRCDRLKMKYITDNLAQHGGSASPQQTVCGLQVYWNTPKGLEKCHHRRTIGVSYHIDGRKQHWTRPCANSRQSKDEMVTTTGLFTAPPINHSRQRCSICSFTPSRIFLEAYKSLCNTRPKALLNVIYLRVPCCYFVNFNSYTE